jgi:negative regulator of sigma F NrsF-like protein
LAEQLRQPTFAVGLGAAAVTGLLSAIAAFAISIPDRSRWWLLLPAPALVVWVGTLRYGCFASWVSIGPAGVQMGEALSCFSSLALTSAPLGIALMVMLRYAARLRDGAVTMMGALYVQRAGSFPRS